MILFHHIAGQNLVTYKEFRYEFTPNTINVIRGSNRTGKTLVFSSMASLIFNEMPLNPRRGSAKQMHSNSSQLELGVINNKIRWLLRQYGTERGVSYTISKNQEELRPSKIVEAQNILREAIPFPPDLLFTTTLVNPLRGHPLLNSKQGVRHNYFEEMFDLVVYDHIYAELDASAKGMRIASRDLINSQERTKAIGTELGGIHFNREQFDGLNQRYEDLQRRHNTRQGQAGKLSNWLAVASAINSEQTPEQLRYQLGKTEAVERHLQVSWTNLNQQLANQKAYQRYKTQVEQIDAELAQLPKTPPNNEIRENSALSRAMITKLEGVKPVIHELEEIQNNLDQSTDIYLEVAVDVTSQINVTQDTIRRLTHIASHKSCPTCGTQLDPQFITTLLNNARKDLTRLQHEQATYVEFVRQNKLRQRRTELTGVLNSKAISVNITSEQIVNKLRNLELAVTECNELLRIAERRRQLSTLRANITLVSATPSEVTEQNVETEKRAWLAVQQQCSNLVNNLKLHEQLAKIGEDYGDVATARKHLSNLQQQLSREDEQLENLQRQIFQARDSLTRGRLLQKEFNELQQKIEQLEAVARDSELYEHLLAAYGPKGLRIARVQYLTQVWLDNMNSFVNLIISEPYTFSLDVDINRFIILAERSNKISEIAGALSGSEHRSFIALNALAMLHLLPSHYRSNIIVLDEIEAGLDADSRILFATEFLPKLTELVNNITIVTPLSPEEISIPDAREFRVEKVRGVSNLRLLTS
jgi:hypothetical protein